jgi:hypothetical protein
MCADTDRGGRASIVTETARYSRRIVLLRSTRRDPQRDPVPRPAEGWRGVVPPRPTEIDHRQVQSELGRSTCQNRAGTRRWRRSSSSRRLAVRVTQVFEELPLVGEPWHCALSDAPPSLSYGFNHGVIADFGQPLVEERGIAGSIVRCHNRTLPTGWVTIGLDNKPELSVLVCLPRTGRARRALSTRPEDWGHVPILSLSFAKRER